MSVESSKRGEGRTHYHGVPAGKRALPVAAPVKAERKSLKGTKRGMYVMSDKGLEAKSRNLRESWARRTREVSVTVKNRKERGAQMAGPLAEFEGVGSMPGSGSSVKVLDGSEFAACMPSRKYLAAYQPGARGERVAVRSVLAFAEWEDVGCRDWLVGKILKAAAMRPGDFVPGEQVLPEVGRERAGFFLRAGFGAGEAALLGTA